MELVIALFMFALIAGFCFIFYQIAELFCALKQLVKMTAEIKQLKTEIKRLKNDLED